MKQRVLALMLVLSAGPVLTMAGCATQEEPAEVVERAPIEVRSGVDRAVATTGDVITYQVSIEHDAKLVIEQPQTGSEIGGFRIIDLGREESEEKGRKHRKQWFELRADLVGSYVLPSISVRYRPQHDETLAAGQPEAWQTVETSEIFVEVASVLAEGEEPTELRDIKPLHPPPPRPWTLIALITGGLLLTALGLLLWWRKRRAQETLEAARLPPHEEAFAQLSGLRDIEASDPEAVRRWYFRLSEVVRTYIEGRFGLNATDLTTPEIDDALSTLKALAGEQQGSLKQFLHHSDDVKFAALHPEASDIEASYETVLSFVEATKPIAEVA